MKLTVSFSAIPLLAHAATLAQQGCVTGASHRNWASYGLDVSLPADMPDWQRHSLTDPQTSGGLLVACTADRAKTIAQMIVAAGYSKARIIGQVEAGVPSVTVRV
jgi:selenide,water dikinase